MGLGLKSFVLNKLNVTEKGQDSQPTDNPQGILELSSRKTVSAMNVYDTLGITDPVAVTKISCVCIKTKGQHMLVGSVVLNIEIRYVQKDAEVRDSRGNVLGKRTQAGVDRTLKHERFHATFFEGLYNKHIETLKSYPGRIQEESILTSQHATVIA